MTEPRRPLAARAAPPFEIATRAGSLAAPAVHVVAPPPPAVAARSVPLAPAVALAPPGPPLAPACATAVAPLEPPAVVAERPHAVVVETAAGEVALAIEAVSARATLEAPRCRSRAAALVPPAVRKGSLEPVSSIRLEPIDASTLSQERLRSLLTRLWRASGAASPGEPPAGRHLPARARRRDRQHRAGARRRDRAARGAPREGAPGPARGRQAPRGRRARARRGRPAGRNVTKSAVPT